MTSFFKIATVLCLLVASLCTLSAQDRQVIICLDESGSMSSSWDELNYALQTIIALIDEKDDLIIVTGGGRDELHINTSRKISEVSAWHGRRRRNNNSEYLVIPKANELIRKNPGKETLLIFIGDGRWVGSEGPGKELTRIYEAQKPRIIFFKIGEHGGSELETALSGIPTLEVMFTPRENSSQLKKNLNDLAHKIVEGKEGDIKLDFNAGSVSFKPIFPLKKVIVLLQDANCELSGINGGYELEGPIDITNQRVDGELEGKCYEIKSRSGSVIDIGKEIILNCSSAACCRKSNANLNFIPIVALDLKNEVDGNFIDRKPEINEYVLCEKETEVNIHSFLVDMNKKKIKLGGIRGLSIKVDNGSSTRELTISGDTASGRVALTGAVTYVTVESVYEGYFQKKSNIFTFIRKECPLALDISVAGDVRIANENNHIYEVCPAVKTVEFTASIVDNAGTTKPFSDFSAVDIFLKKGTSKTALSKRGNAATGDLELETGDTQVTLVLEVNGGTVYESPPYTFKRISCGPEKDNTTLVIETAPIMEFAQDGRCAEQVRIVRADGSEIDYRQYDFELTGVPMELKVRIDSSGSNLRICFEKNPVICDCFVRHGTFGGMIIAHPKNKSMVRVEKEWTFTLEKENNFWIRCKFCLISGLILGLLLWYLYGIWTKPRFHHSARFDVVEVDNTAIYAPPNKRPRRILKTSFFNRYLLPYIPESKIVDGMKFKASATKTLVFLAKESISEKLSKNGEPLNPKSRKDLRIYRNNTLELEKRPNITVIYTLKVK